MKYMKLGDNVDSNIFNQLDEKKRDLIARGVDVINLSVGTPDFKPEEFIMKTVSDAALIPENYKYTLGDQPFLIEAVQGWYQRRYNVSLTPGQIMSVNGSQEGIAHVCFPFIHQGDLILCPDPGYPIFTFGPMMAGAEIGLYPLYEEKGWILDFDDIPEEAARRAKMIVVSYPNNPTTAIARPDFYEKLVAFAKKYDIIVLHDNAYSELIYDGTEGLSFLQTPGAMDVGMECNSLSKSYNLTGMRTSFMLGNEALISKFRAFRSQFDYGMFRVAQIGAAAALNGPQDSVARIRRDYGVRSRALCGALRSAGWNVPDSESTMFVWAKIPPRFTSSVAFTLELMEKTGVIVVPGTSFGERGEGYVRMALVVPPERAEEAAKRIKESGILE